MQATPATWQMLVDAAGRSDRLTALCGGEARWRRLRGSSARRIAVEPLWSDRDDDMVPGGAS
jgi:hypothetical protein